MEPERRVRQLVVHYGPINVLHPAILELCKSSQHEAMFEQCLRQELMLVRSRSDRLDHHEISITQKAFMILMDNLDHHVGGVELYVEEIIGLKLLTAEEKGEALQTAVNARSLILNNPARDEQVAPRWYGIKDSQANEEELFLSPTALIENPEAQNRPASVSEVKEGLVKPDSPERVTSPAPAFNLDSDPNFSRLWHLFEVARDDFRSHYIDNHQKTKAAKFLRDTAENVIDYVKLKQPPGTEIDGASSSEPERLAWNLSELRSLLNQAVEVAQTACGGKKRRFEYRKTDVPGEPETSQSKGSSQKNVRQPEITTRPIHSRRERRPHAHYRGQRKVLWGERPRPAGPQGVSRKNETKTPAKDSYRPVYPHDRVSRSA